MAAMLEAATGVSALLGLSGQTQDLPHYLSAGSTVLPAVRLASLVQEAPLNEPAVQEEELNEGLRKKLLQDVTCALSEANKYTHVLSVGDAIWNLPAVDATDEKTSACTLLVQSTSSITCSSSSDAASFAQLQTIGDNFTCGYGHSIVQRSDGQQSASGFQLAKMDAKTAVSDPADRSFPASFAAVTGDNRGTCCRFKASAFLCYWTVRFTSPTGHVPSYVHVAWERGSAPAVALLQLSTDGVEWVTCDGQDLSSIEKDTDLYGMEMYGQRQSSLAASSAPVLTHGTFLTCMRKGPTQPLCNLPQATALRLICRGVHPGNRVKRIGIQSVSVWCHEGTQEVSPPPRCDLAPLLSQIALVVREGKDAGALAAFLRHMTRVTLSTGSLSVPIAVASALLQLSSSLPPSCSHAVRALTHSLKALGAWKKRRAAAIAWTASHSEGSSVAMPTWDMESKCTRHVSVQDGGSSAVCMSADDRHQIALGTTGFPIRGRHSWTIRIVQDVNGDECMCAGFAVWPVRDTEYSRTTDMWMVRCYNGQLYARQNCRVMSRIPHGPVHPGSDLTFTLDGDARTVSLSVDHTPQGVIFTLPMNAELNTSALHAAREAGQNINASQLPPPMVYPCVSFYAPGRKATLVSVHTERVEPPDPRVKPYLASVPLMELPSKESSISPAAAISGQAAGRSGPGPSPRGTPQLVGSVGFGGELPRTVEGTSTTEEGGTDSHGAPAGLAELEASQLVRTETLADGTTVSLWPEDYSPPSKRVCLGPSRRMYEHTVALQPDPRILRFAMKNLVAQAWKVACAGREGMDAKSTRTESVLARESSGGSIRRAAPGELTVNTAPSTLPSIPADHVSAKASMEVVSAVARWDMCGAWDSLSFGLGVHGFPLSLLSTGLELRAYGVKAGCAPGQVGTLLWSSKETAPLPADCDLPTTFTLDVRDCLSVAFVLVSSMSVVIEGSGSGDGWKVGMCDAEGGSGDMHMQHVMDCDSLVEVESSVLSSLGSGGAKLPVVILVDPVCGPEPLATYPSVRHAVQQGEEEAARDTAAQLDTTEVVQGVLKAVSDLDSPAQNGSVLKRDEDVSRFYSYLESCPGATPMHKLVEHLRASQPAPTPEAHAQTPLGGMSGLQAGNTRRVPGSGLAGASFAHVGPPGVPAGGTEGRGAPGAPPGWRGAGPPGVLTTDALTAALAQVEQAAAALRAGATAAGAPAAPAARTAGITGEGHGALDAEAALARAIAMSLAEAGPITVPIGSVAAPSPTGAPTGAPAVGWAAASAGTPATSVAVVAAPPAPVRRTAADVLRSLMSEAQLRDNFGIEAGSEVDDDLAAALLLSMDQGHLLQGEEEVAAARGEMPTFAGAPLYPPPAAGEGPAPAEGVSASGSSEPAASLLAQPAPLAAAEGLSSAAAEGTSSTGPTLEAQSSSSSRAPQAMPQSDTHAGNTAAASSTLSPVAEQAGDAQVVSDDNDATDADPAVDAPPAVQPPPARAVYMSLRLYGHMWLVQVGDAGLPDGETATVQPASAVDNLVGSSTVETAPVAVPESSPAVVEGKAAVSTRTAFASSSEVPAWPPAYRLPTAFSVTPDSSMWSVLTQLLRTEPLASAAGTGVRLLCVDLLKSAFRALPGQDRQSEKLQSVRPTLLQQLLTLLKTPEIGLKPRVDAALSLAICWLCPSASSRIDLVLAHEGAVDDVLPEWMAELLHLLSWDALQITVADLVPTSDDRSNHWLRLLSAWSAIPCQQGDFLQSPKAVDAKGRDLGLYKELLVNAVARHSIAVVCATLLDGPACINYRLSTSSLGPSAVTTGAHALLALTESVLPAYREQLKNQEHPQTIAASLVRMLVFVWSLCVGHMPVACLAGPTLLPLLDLLRAQQGGRRTACPVAEPVNVLKAGLPANRDNFTGSVGLRLRVPVSVGQGPVVVSSLGRYVDPAVNHGQLQRAHTLTLWREADKSLVAFATVDASSSRDQLGYAIAPLSHPVVLQPGQLYRVASTEVAGSGDAWFDPVLANNKEAPPHDTRLVNIYGDCWSESPGQWCSSPAAGQSGADSGDGPGSSTSFLAPSGDAITYPAYISSQSRKGAMGPVTLFATALRDCIPALTSEDLLPTLSFCCWDVLCKATAVILAGHAESEEEEAVGPWLALGYACPQTSATMERCLFESSVQTGASSSSNRFTTYSGLHSTLHVPRPEGWHTVHMKNGAELEALQHASVSEASTDTAVLTPAQWGFLLALAHSQEAEGAAPGSSGAAEGTSTSLPPWVAERLKTASAEVLSSHEHWCSQASPVAVVLEDCLQPYAPEPKLARRKAKLLEATGPLLAAILLHAGAVKEALEACLAKSQGQQVPSFPLLALVWSRFKSARTWLRTALSEVKRVEVDRTAGSTEGTALPALAVRRRRSSTAEGGAATPALTSDPADAPASSRADWTAAGARAPAHEEGRGEDGSEDEEETEEEGEEEDAGEEEHEDEEEEEHEEEEQEAVGDRAAATAPRPVTEGGDASPTLPSLGPALFALGKRKVHVRKERALAQAPSSVQRLLQDVRSRCLYLLCLPPALARFEGGARGDSPLVQYLLSEMDQEKQKLADAKAAIAAEEGGAGEAVSSTGDASVLLPSSAAIAWVTTYVRHAEVPSPRAMISCYVRGCVRAMQRRAGLQQLQNLLQTVTLGGMGDAGRWMEVLLRYVPHAVQGCSYKAYERASARAIAVSIAAVSDRAALLEMATLITLAHASASPCGLEFIPLPSVDASVPFLQDMQAAHGHMPRALIRFLSMGDLLAYLPVPGCHPAWPPPESQARKTNPPHPRWSVEASRAIQAGGYKGVMPHHTAFGCEADSFLHACGSQRASVREQWQAVLSQLASTAQTLWSTGKDVQPAVRFTAAALPLLCGAGLAAIQSLQTASASPSPASLVADSDAIDLPCPAVVAQAARAGKVTSRAVVGMVCAIMGLKEESYFSADIEEAIAAYQRCYAVQHSPAGQHGTRVGEALALWTHALGQSWLCRCVAMLAHFLVCKSSYAKTVSTLRAHASCWSRSHLVIARGQGAANEEEESGEEGAHAAVDREVVAAERSTWRLILQQTEEEWDASAVQAGLKDCRLLSLNGAQSQTAVEDALVPVFALLTGPSTERAVACIAGSGIMATASSALQQPSMSAFCCRMIIRLLRMLALQGAPLEQLVEIEQQAGHAPVSLLQQLLTLLMNWSAALMTSSGSLPSSLPVGSLEDVRACCQEAVALLRVMWRESADCADYLANICRSSLVAAVCAAAGNASDEWRVVPPLTIMETTAVLGADRLTAACSMLRIISTSSACESISHGAVVFTRQTPLLGPDTHADVHALVGPAAATGVAQAGVVVEYNAAASMVRVAHVEVSPFFSSDSSCVSVLGFTGSSAHGSGHRSPYSMLVPSHGAATDEPAIPGVAEWPMVDLACLNPVDPVGPPMHHDLALVRPSRSLSNPTLVNQAAHWLMALLALAGATVSEVLLQGKEMRPSHEGGARKTVVSADAALLMSLRSLAVGCLEQSLRDPDSAVALLSVVEGSDGSARTGLLRLLVNACEPIRARSFVAPARYAQMNASIERMRLSARALSAVRPSRPLVAAVKAASGQSVPAGLELVKLGHATPDSPTPPGSSGSAAGSAAPRPSDADVARREAATLLCSMGLGFDMEQCMAALRRNGDDLNRTADFLMSSDARRVLQAEQDARQAAASGPAVSAAPTALAHLGLGGLGMGGGSGTSSGSSAFLSEEARKAKASDLSSIWGMPVTLCYQALLISSDDANSAMSWLMDRGAPYVESMLVDESTLLSMAQMDRQAEAEAETRAAQDDTSVLENTHILPPLIDAVEGPSTGGAAGAPGEDGQAVQLSSPRRNNPIQPKGALPTNLSGRAHFTLSQLRSHRAAMGDSELLLLDRCSDLPQGDALSAALSTLFPSGQRVYLTRYAGRVDDSFSSPLQLQAGGHGVVDSQPVVTLPIQGGSASLHMLQVWVRNAQSQGMQLRLVPMDGVKVCSTVYGVEMEDDSGLRAVQCSVLAAITQHALRRTVVAALQRWPARIPMTVTAVGGACLFSRLLKLCAASSSVFSSGSLDSVADGGSSGGSEAGKEARDEADADPYAVLSRVRFGRTDAKAGLDNEAAVTEIVVLPLSAEGHAQGIAVSAAGPGGAGQPREGAAGPTPSRTGRPSTFGLTAPQSTPGLLSQASPYGENVLARSSGFASPPSVARPGLAGGAGSVVDDDEEGRTGVADGRNVLDVLRSVSLRLLLDEVRRSPSLTSSTPASTSKSHPSGSAAQQGRPPLSARKATPVQGTEAHDEQSHSTPGQSPLLGAALLDTAPAGRPSGADELPDLDLGLGLESAVGVHAGDLPASSAVAFAATSPLRPPQPPVTSGNSSPSLSRHILDECVHHFMTTTGSVAGGRAGEVALVDEKRLILESLHPIVPKSEYVQEIVVEDARAIRLAFDPRCELFTSQCTLTFYADRGCSIQLASYPVRAPSATGDVARGSSAFPPLVVQSDRVWVKFRADRRSESVSAWGYRCAATALKGLAWSNEGQAVSDTESSLQWACWSLDFLLQEAGVCSPELFSSAHSPLVLDALVRYLCTPKAPYKASVAALLTKLLMHPQAFPQNHTPDLKRLLSISDYVLTKASTERDGGRTFLPPSLLRLVELAVASFKAQREMDRRVAGSREQEDSGDVHESMTPAPSAPGIGAGYAPLPVMVTREGTLLPPMCPIIPRADDTLTLKDVLLDTSDLVATLSTAPSMSDVTPALAAWLEGDEASGALRSGAMLLPHVESLERAMRHRAEDGQHAVVPASSNRLPDALLSRAWLDACAYTALVESDHPYAAGQSRGGWLVIPGASSIKLALDRRSAVAAGCKLQFWNKNGELVRFCGTMPGNSSGGEVNSAAEREGAGLMPGNMKAWTKAGIDTVEVQGDRVRWEWLAPSSTGEAPPSVPVPAEPVVHEESTTREVLAALPSCSAHPAGLWGFAVTAQGCTWTSVPATRSSRNRELLLLRAAAERAVPSLAVPPSDSPVSDTSTPRTISHGALSLHQAALYMACWPKELDSILVAWMSSHSAKALGAEESDEAPHATAAIGSRRTVRSAVDALPADVRLSRKEWKFAYDLLSRVPLRALHLRAALLRLWNKRVSRLLELVDVRAADAASRADSMASLLAAVGANQGVLGQKVVDPSQMTAAASLLSVQIRSLGHLIYSELKQRLLDASISLTTSAILRSMPRPNISIDNMRAMASIDAGTVDIHSSQSSFLQAYRALSKLGASTMSALCRSPVDDRGRVWTVRFVGEEGIDYGGVFRDALTRMVEDCFTTDRLDLQVPTPNALLVGEGGEAGDLAISGAEKYVPNPAYTHPNVIGKVRPMFEFLGRLAGMSLRLKLSMAFEWPSLVWKGLVGAPLDLEDLRQVDMKRAQLLQAIATWQPAQGALYSSAPLSSVTMRTPLTASRTPGMKGTPVPPSLPTSNSPGLRGKSARSPATPFLRQTPGSTSLTGTGGLGSAAAQAVQVQYTPEAEAAFAQAFPGLSFTAQGYDGRRVELIPQGQKVRVTLANRWQYIASATSFALSSVDPLIRSIRQGLYSVVAPRAVRMLTWQELEVAVSGKPEIDLRLLKAHTDLEGYRPTDTVIQHFWKVMEGFTQEERSLFIRFAWGRARLPAGRRWPKRFKITRRSVADNAGLPLAHTCFFSIELPPYASEERMRSALLAAIHYGSGGILNA